MPKISVIIPVYKVENTLRRCVDSVLNQTFTDYEVILVNDGSPDGSPDICDEYDKNYKSVTVIHKENGGVSSARNAGLEIARGEYVMFLDSDDYIEADCLEKLSGNGADMCVGSIVGEFDNGNKKYQKKRKDEIINSDEFSKEIPELFVERRLNYIHGKLYRRKIITDNKLSFEDYLLSLAEDTLFNFVFLKYCKTVFICGENVHHYVNSAGGLGSKFFYDRYLCCTCFNDVLETICGDMGIMTPVMRYELDCRLVRGAVWSLDGIRRQEKISYKETRKALEQIYSDQKLRAALKNTDIPYRDDLVELLGLGTERYFRKLVLKRKYGKFRKALGR